MDLLCNQPDNYNLEHVVLLHIELPVRMYPDMDLYTYFLYRPYLSDSLCLIYILAYIQQMDLRDILVCNYKHRLYKQHSLHMVRDYMNLTELVVLKIKVQNFKISCATEKKKNRFLIL